MEYNHDRIKRQAERIKELEAEVARWMQAHKDAWEIIDNRDHGASDHIQALEAEVARLMEAIASNDLKTLGRIAQEQAAALWNENDRLKDQLETLQKENEGWDQQAQEVERLREEVARLTPMIDLNARLVGENTELMEQIRELEGVIAVQSSVQSPEDVDAMFNDWTNSKTPPIVKSPSLVNDELTKEVKELKDMLSEAVEAGREAQLMVNILQASGTKLNPARMFEYKRLYESCAKRTRKINQYNDRKAEAKPYDEPLDDIYYIKS